MLNNWSWSNNVSGKTELPEKEFVLKKKYQDTLINTAGIIGFRNDEIIKREELSGAMQGLERCLGAKFASTKSE